MKLKAGIDIEAVNAKFVEQDEAFREFARVTQLRVLSDMTVAEVVQTTILTEGLAVIHERLGNLITLMLQNT